MNCLYDISPSLHNITQQMWAKEEQEVQNQSQSELILDVSEHNKNILRHPRSSELWFQEYYTQHLLQNDHSFWSQYRKLMNISKFFDMIHQNILQGGRNRSRQDMTRHDKPIFDNTPSRRKSTIWIGAIGSIGKTCVSWIRLVYPQGACKILEILSIITVPPLYAIKQTQMSCRT